MTDTTIDTPNIDITPVVISRRQLAKMLTKFRVNNGDVLAIQTGSISAKVEIVKAITEALGRIGRKDVIVVVVDDFSEMKVLNETEMNKQGWYRIKTLRKFI